MRTTTEPVVVRMEKSIAVPFRATAHETVSSEARLLKDQLPVRLLEDQLPVRCRFPVRLLEDQLPEVSW